jgi:hypothetical protein
MNYQARNKPDPFVATVVLPDDDLTTRRKRRRVGELTPQQVQRLIVAAALRDKSKRAD